MAENRRNYNKKRTNNRHNNLQLGDHSYFSCFSDNPEKVKALVNKTKKALTPYYDFLNEAIKAEEKKSSYEIDWKKVESNFSLSITSIYSKFKIEKPKTIFKVFIKDMDILKDTDNKLVFDTQDKIERFNKDNVKVDENLIYLKVETLPLDNEILDLNRQEVKYELTNLSLNSDDTLHSDGKDYKIERLEELESGWNVYIKTDKNLKELSFNSKKLNCSKYNSSFEQLFDEESEYKYEKMGNEYHSEKLPKSKILKDENDNEYSWKENKNSNQKDIVIQLIDDDSNDDKAISEYFFEDDVKTIYQENDKKLRFDIKKKKIDDKILIFRQDWKNPKQLKTGENIKIKVDTGNLKKQQDSIKLLNNSPVKNQQNLIKLFEDKQKGAKWERVRKKEISDWYILNDKNYDGTLDQREFVKKAIATDDFAILEGPPGSGKTTTILELVLQLLKLGKKILLSASTHVAIDNVLERIYKPEIYKNVEILRIGRGQSVSESITHLQIDAKIETYIKNGFDKNIAEQIVLDSANLVCGTTMGINQFPPIRDRVNFNNGRREDSVLPMDTIFDYMIIDESSKTTFQEFLVPAMLAKKWILVGDIKQLSPFIEQSHIVHNFNVLIPKETQKAIRIVFETLHNTYDKRNNIQNPYIVEVSASEEKEIKIYLDCWHKKENNPYKDKVISYSDEQDLFKKLGSDLILIKDKTFNNIKKYLPKTHIVILKKDNETDDFWFKQKYLNHKQKLQKFSQKNKEFLQENDPVYYKDFFKSMLKEKSWAEEITWRMIRVYERRMLKNPDSNYEKSFELLKPVDKNNPVDRIYNMTLPSILESIQVGNGENHKNNTTITDGFDKRDLKQRHETLKIQHRMHPDISMFSREEFYTENGTQALQNASTINREWKYNRYYSRAVWLDVKKKDNSNGRNYEEVKVVMDEVKKFLEFTEQNPTNQNGKPWSIAVLTFHQAQATILRDGIRKLTSQPNKMSKFNIKDVEILLYTVDKFQGMEADIVFISMMKTQSIGFLDNINRLNVALTRAKYQRVIVGDRNFFTNKQNGSPELKRLAKNGGI
jgi:superfamily I DNA and/or RNA helicase